jgi:hypothetical protein
MGSHFEGSGPDWRQIRESPAHIFAKPVETSATFPPMSSITPVLVTALGSHSPDWRPKINSSLRISPDTGNRNKYLMPDFANTATGSKPYFEHCPTPMSYQAHGGYCLRRIHGVLDCQASATLSRVNKPTDMVSDSPTVNYPLVNDSPTVNHSFIR